MDGHDGKVPELVVFAAAELALSSESCAPMFAVIDMESTLMLHGVPAIRPVLPATAVSVSP